MLNFCPPYAKIIVECGETGILIPGGMVCPHTNEDTEKEIENEEAQTEDLQPNLQTGSITVQKDGHFIHCLTVIGQIEGHYILPSQNKTTK